MPASYRYHGGSPQHGRKTMPAMLSLDALDTRLSVPTRQLATPGPDAAQLQRMLQTAVRVPDHGKRVPFRFLRIAGPARANLAAAAAERLREREPDAGEAVVDKLLSVGFTRLRTRLNFKGNRYLAEKETWTDYPDLPA